MTYIVQRQDRFYVVAYDGLDPSAARSGDAGIPSAATAMKPKRSANTSTRDRVDQRPPVTGPITVATFFNETWLPRKRRQVRATTAYRYAWFIERYINPAIGDVPLRRLRVDHLEALYQQLAVTGGRHGAGIAPKTILEVDMIVRAALGVAADRQLVVSNVAASAQLKLPRAGGPIARSWTAVELAIFLATSRHHRLYPALHLAAHTGMRRGEIVGLKWCDLDTGARRLSIRRTLQCVGGQPVEFGVKTRTSRRTVELDAATMTLLRRWRQRLERDGLPSGIDDWMFCNPAGRYLNPQSLSQLFDRIVRGTQLSRIRFHDLRHTHASLLVAAGESVKVVSERLGHAHPAFTIHTYQHLLPGMSAAAADRFATMIATANR